ncbi:hypothetical protein ES695_05465, partial [Candidatus Atribacteria bacterium 1244-E10-H5-B2]
MASKKLEKVFLSYSFGVNITSNGSLVLALITIFTLNPRATKFLVINFRLVLSLEDFIFGSHRSHGEVLAKCFSAIDELEENELL